MQQTYVGLDVGGTTIKAGLCDAAGRLLAACENPTLVDQGIDAVISQMDRSARQTVAQANRSWDDVAGIGLGMPGFLDIPQRIVRFSANFPHWIDVPLGMRVEEITGKCVKVNNDANAATLGEVWSGAGRQCDAVVMFTLGTGVGGGIFLHGKLFEGFRGLAGEFGHIPVWSGAEAVQCGCGQWGCVETVSSATGIVRMAQEANLFPAQTPMTAKVVFEAAENQHPIAQRIVHEAVTALAKAMCSVAVILNPQRIIIGGGVSKAGEALFVPLRKAFAQCTPPEVHHGVDVVAAQLGNHAGMIGAAGLHVHAV